MEGAFRFLKRLWRLANQHIEQGIITLSKSDFILDLSESQQAMRCQTHKTIASVTNDIGQRYTFNTAIAKVMELQNTLYKYKEKDSSDMSRMIQQEALESIVLMLSPIVPHICHVLWKALGHSNDVIEAAWPIVDAQALIRNSIELVIQVNGKLRARIELPADASRDETEKLAVADENVKKFIEGKGIVKVIIVPGRLVNIVVK
jgi:leucyl-tRNA synthetase